MVVLPCHFLHASSAAGLQALRRQLSRSRPVADQLLAAFIAASPGFSELHGIWDVQVSAKDLKTALELLHASTAVLRYRPSTLCSAELRQQIQKGQEQYACSLLKRRCGIFA